MKAILAAVGGAALAGLIGAGAQAAGEAPGGADPSARQLVMEGAPQQGIAPCQSCHGADGRSPVARYPHLAGQYRDYLAQALRAYRDGEREDPTMSQQAQGLSDAQIEALAAYFAGRAAAVRPLR